jgi:hypothetical protein
MAEVKLPAQDWFAARIHHDLVVAQVWIRHAEGRFELRHVEDRSASGSSLKALSAPDLRPLAQVTRAGAFRPLKAAPNLQRGWRHVARNPRALYFAMNQIYPGAVADWHAAEVRGGPVTDYDVMTARQTGMYRITHLLKGPQAARMATVCCDRAFCLKTRLWKAGEAVIDPKESEGKSVIPCLEPCAVLLEFARSVARWEQDEALDRRQSPEALEGIRRRLALGNPDGTEAASGMREADFGAEENPRRLRWLLAKAADPSMAL